MMTHGFRHMTLQQQGDTLLRFQSMWLATAYGHVTFEPDLLGLFELFTENCLPRCGGDYNWKTPFEGSKSWCLPYLFCMLLSKC